MFLLAAALSLKRYYRTLTYGIKSMIDTIILMLSSDTFNIKAPDNFKPSARWILDNSSGSIYMQSKQNPTKKELLNSIYKPRLTLFKQINSKDKLEVILKVELSLPKLLFGNNFDELQSKDFSLVTQKLTAVLETMGVVTSAPALAKASINAIHYSKNITLTDGSTPYHYINKIKEANIKLSLDVNQTDYRNEGHGYKWHCNSYEVAFYDKIKDLEKAKQSSKRALEKDSAIQLNIFGTLRQRKKLEILRMEVRLNKRQKIKQLFKTLNIKSDLTFKSLFKISTSKKVLLHYLDELESKRPTLLDYRAPNGKASLSALILNNLDLNPKHILQIYGLKQALELVTIRELRAMFAHSNKRGWYRLMADVNKIKLPLNQSPFNTIREHIITFKPLKLTKL